MRTLLLLGCDRDLTSRIRRLLPADWRTEEAADWPNVVSRMSSADPPQLFLFTARELHPDVRRTVVALRRRGYFVPAAVYLGSPAPVLAHLAGRLHHHGVHSIFGALELEHAVRALLRRSPPDLRAALARVLDLGPGTGTRLLALLERRRELVDASPERLAAELGCSRTALYRALRAAGLPPPGSIQALYRLWPGVMRIVTGGRGSDAAFEAGCPHYGSFRKGLVTHFGMTIGQLRAAGSTQAVLHRWIDVHRGSGAPSRVRELARAPGALTRSGA